MQCQGHPLTLQTEGRVRAPHGAASPYFWLFMARAGSSPHGAVSMSRRFPQAPQPSEPGWSLTGIEMVDEATYVMVRGVRLLLFVVIVCCYR